MPEFDNAIKWWGFIKNFSFGWVLLLILLLLLLFKTEFVLNVISKIQKGFLWIGPGIRKNQIENDIKSNIIKVSKNATKEIEDVIPYKLQIKWVKSSDRQAFFDGNKVIVCVDNHRNRMHTIVHTVNNYVNNGLLAKEKSCIEDDVYKASCLVVTRKLLMDCYEPGISFFFNTILNKEMESDDEIRESIGRLITLDENGLFIQILLREVKEKSNLVFGKLDNSLFMEETKGFILFLHNLAIRDYGDDKTKLTFDGNYYKVGIILVAKPMTYFKGGEDSYVKRFRQNVAEGKDSIYLCARNEKIKIVKKVASEIKKIKYIKSYKVKFIKEIPYNGIRDDRSNYPGMCVHVKLQKKKAKQKVV